MTTCNRRKTMERPASFSHARAPTRPRCVVDRISNTRLTNDLFLDISCDNDRDFCPLTKTLRNPQDPSLFDSSRLVAAARRYANDFSQFPCAGGAGLESFPPANSASASKSPNSTAHDVTSDMKLGSFPVCASYDEVKHSYADLCTG